MSLGRLVVENHRGDPVPRVLGICLAATGAGSTLILAATGLAGGVGARGWGASVACGLVFAAGMVDDLTPIGPRGLRNHLRSLRSGRMTTGILKLVVTVAAAGVVVTLQQGRSTPVRLAGVLLIAGTTNVWNGLDVRPGRALKGFLPSGAGLLVAVPVRLLPPLIGLWAGALLALWPDLRERAMLGDGGANLLGFATGVGLYIALPSWGVAVGAAAAVALNVVADTITFSRVIGSTPPLRWLDRLGRRPE
jgi:UDP-GlcNAc:undecaprenyl-phosphate GlcNAc-1-phosphate transferase